ncbi:MAG: hypothetical protein WAJ86_12395, partial [Candidatus Acidiferrales bacterium]
MTDETPIHARKSRRRRYAGEAVLRAEDEQLLRGGGGFLPDLPASHTAEICMVRSTQPHAIVRAIRKERALAGPGVIAVLAASDLEFVDDRLPCVDMIPGTMDVRQRAIARDRVR